MLIAMGLYASIFGLLAVLTSLQNNRQMTHINKMTDRYKRFMLIGSQADLLNECWNPIHWYALFHRAYRFFIKKKRDWDD